MYSLALIILVVSEKKAFEHFLIGSNVNLWMVLYKLHVFCSDMKFKMVATAGLSLSLDPMGKMFQNASSLKPLGPIFIYSRVYSISEQNFVNKNELQV
jgi:hypothetical protein